MIRPEHARVLLAIVLVAAFTGCGQSNVVLQPVAVHPTPIVSAPMASPTASPTVSPTPTAKPATTPTASPSVTSTPSASPTPSVSASASALWAILSDSVVEFQSSQIASGTVTPYHQFSIANSNFSMYSSMAFDHAGDMWIGEGNLTISNGNYTGQIVEFTAAQLAALAASPNPTPHATLTVAGAVDGLAFDASGKLWASVFTFGAYEFMAFTPAQLAAGGGSPTPGITDTVQTEGAIAFSSDGSLYLSPQTVFGPSAGIIYGYAPSQLTGSGSLSANYTLQPSGSSLVISGQEAQSISPNQIAFDAGGNLWSIFNGYTFALAASSIHSNTAVTMTSFQGYPAQSSGGTYTIYNGYALAFDGAFNLIENSSTNTLHEYASAQYANADPTPAVAMFGSTSTPYNSGVIGNFVIAGPYVP